jgi:uncharacterized protein (TIGR02246 family)
MKRLLGSVLVVPFVFAMATASAQDAELEARVAEAQDQYAEAWMAGDAEGVANVFTEDAIYWPESGGVFEGREAIRSQLEEELAHGVPTSVDITSSRVEQLDGVILDIGTFSATMPDEAVGEVRGEYVVLAQDTDEGVRIRRLIAFPTREAPDAAQ